MRHGIVHLLIFICFAACFYGCRSSRSVTRKTVTEATGEEAKTLHRVLEIGKFASEDEINPDLLVTPIDANVVIIDEASMIDLFLMNYLMKALYSGTKLILVGDENQLPSVGPGNVLKDIIASEKVPVVTLNKIFRQAAKSKIVLNAHRVNNGLGFIKNDDEEIEEDTKQDFFFIKQNSTERMLQEVISLSTGRLEKFGNYDFFKNIQVLTPTKKGPLGTRELNKALQAVLNPNIDELSEKKVGDVIYRVGDRVMQIKNNYDVPWFKDGENGTGVFNGDIGILTRIDRANDIINVRFDDKEAMYSIENVKEIELAYAMTVHKSQGSEFPCVVMPTIATPPKLSYRNLFYTALTRAKSLLIIVGNEASVKAMVDNDKKSRRYSALVHFLSVDNNNVFK